jgi:hypothetical protein
LKVDEGVYIYISIFMYSIMVCLKEEKYTHFKLSISIKCRSASIIYRLASGDLLRMIGDLLGVGLNITSIIVRECCKVIKIHLRSLVFFKPTFV